MKLRIKGNSIRIRLTKSEVNQFAKDGYIEEHTLLPNGKLSYVVKKDATVNELSADLSKQTVVMLMPEHDATNWVQTERVGYENNMILPGGEKLYLLIEKDFKCLDNTNEDQSDMYDNPLAEFHK
ncbi:MAG: hypothetical protein LW692_02340 [Sphingobacteriales bacterium]|jgi:hypothetical protein|nr:hypothetical protein [Sphingobacteriales bacterium]